MYIGLILFLIKSTDECNYLSVYVVATCSSIDQTFGLVTCTVGLAKHECAH